MTMYSHLGMYQSKNLELRIGNHDVQGGPSVAVTLGDKVIGSIYGSELRQVIQYIVNSGAINVDELIEGKQNADAMKAIL